MRDQISLKNTIYTHLKYILFIHEKFVYYAELNIIHNTILRNIHNSFLKTSTYDSEVTSLKKFLKINFYIIKHKDLL